MEVLIAYHCFAVSFLKSIASVEFNFAWYKRFYVFFQAVEDEVELKEDEVSF